jgi:hypothetical protein
MSHVTRGEIDEGRRIVMRRGAADVVRSPWMSGATETTRESPKRIVAVVMSHVTRGANDVGRRMLTRRGVIDVVRDPSMRIEIAEVAIAETTSESPKRIKIVVVAIAMSHETES